MQGEKHLNILRNLLQPGRRKSAWNVYIEEYKGKQPLGVLYKKAVYKNLNIAKFLRTPILKKHLRTATSQTQKRD